MPVTDPIADMLSRIRNGVSARHERVRIPTSKLKVAIAEVLESEGFIKSYEQQRSASRHQIWTSTGTPWVPPSGNIRPLTLIFAPRVLTSAS